MAQAVAHVILTIVLLDILRHYVFGKKKFPRSLLVVGGIAGLAPDIDIVFEWIVLAVTGAHVPLHALFTHSIFIAIGLWAAAAVLHLRKTKSGRKWAKIFAVIGAGWAFHIFLDCTFTGEPWKLFLWPFQLLPTYCPQWYLSAYGSGIDAIILVAWLLHEELHKKIKDYF